MKLDKKYPEQLFSHWIAMLSVNFPEFDTDGVKEQIEMYKELEGEKEFVELKQEITAIINNGDLDKYLELAKDFGLDKILAEDLTKMTDTILAE